MKATNMVSLNLAELAGRIKNAADLEMKTNDQDDWRYVGIAAGRLMKGESGAYSRLIQCLQSLAHESDKAIGMLEELEPFEHEGRQLTGTPDQPIVEDDDGDEDEEDGDGSAADSVIKPGPTAPVTPTVSAKIEQDGNVKANTNRSDKLHNKGGITPMKSSPKQSDTKAPAVMPGAKKEVAAQPAEMESAVPNTDSKSAIHGVEFADIAQFEIDQEAASMFERNLSVVETLRESLEKDGFLEYCPAKVWDRGNGKLTPFDANTRVELVRNIPKITRIPVVKFHFDSREEFLKAAVDEQVGRRNMSIRDKFAVVRVYAPIETSKATKRHGGQPQFPGIPGNSKGETNEILGRKIGYSADSVAKIRSLIEADDKDLLEKVFSEELSIHAAYGKLTGREKPKSRKVSVKTVDDGRNDDDGSGPSVDIYDTDKGAENAGNLGLDAAKTKTGDVNTEPVAVAGSAPIIGGNKICLAPELVRIMFTNFKDMPGCIEAFFEIDPDAKGQLVQHGIAV